MVGWGRGGGGDIASLRNTQRSRIATTKTIECCLSHVRHYRITYVLLIYVLFFVYQNIRYLSCGVEPPF
jgi:hypothetical protein